MSNAAKSECRRLWAILLCCGATTLQLFAQDGAVDASFQSPLFNALVHVITVEADGRVLYAIADDTIHYTIGRLDTNGSQTASINIGDGPESISPPIDFGTTHIPGATNPATINVLRPLPNGQFLVGGTFSHFNKVAKKALVRLNSDGSVDASFNPSNGFTGDNVSTIVIGPGGMIYAGGKFTKFDGLTRNIGLVRLNPDGTLDGSFVDGTISYGANVTEFTLQPDGKPLIDAAYANASFQATLQLYRMGANGGLDAGFSQGTGTPTAPGPLHHVMMANGQILLTGGSTNYNGNAVNNALFRLNTNGTYDATYPGVTLKLSNTGGLIGRFLPQTNGTIYFSGAFNEVNGQSRNGLARLKTDATLDPAFIPQAYVSPSPGALALQSDGKILAGSSVVVGVQTKYNIIRLNGSGGATTQAPQIGKLTLLQGGSFRLDFSGGISTVVVQSTSDLMNWHAVSTNNVVNGSVTFSDPFVGQSSARFYRLVIPSP